MRVPVTGGARQGSSDEAFWSRNQPGFRFSSNPPGTPEFFGEVERHRYQLEPHIREIVRFERWRGADVLEVGCGIATDGIQFARSGARYVGLDSSPAALSLARRHFALERLEARFDEAVATALPVPDESADLVFSHGVIHHIEDPDQAIAEFRRVLRPGGTALVMVYHRGSLNYHVNIMLVRRAMAPILLIPGVGGLVARLTGEDDSVLDGQRALLETHGLRYLTDRDLFLSNNTDGPGNPLSRVYSRKALAAKFSDFSDVQTAVRYLNLRIWPAGARIEATPLGQRLARRIGWHLYALATK